jgi:D-glycero-alpha-D-manno-heptose 1-phosphate guanylyltransferase
MPQVCIVLAGGLGTRLRSAVADRPKCLAPIGSRPFLQIELESLLAAGVDEVVLSLGHMADLVVAESRRWPLQGRIRHVIETSPLGTGGAIAHAMDSLGLEEVLVANGDTHLDGKIAGMLAALDRGAGERLRMALVHVIDRGRFGGVEIDSSARVGRFLEKGQHGPGLINAGLYRLLRTALPDRHPGSYSLEADVLPTLVAQRAVTALPIDGRFTDIGVPDDYFRFCAEHGP